MDLSGLGSKEWYVQRFSARPHIMVQGGLTTTKGLKKTFGKSYEYLVTVLKKEYCEAYFYKNGLNGLGQFIIRKHKENKNFIPSFRYKSTRIFNNMQNLVVNADLRSLSLRDAVKFYHQVQQFWEDYWSIAHVIEGFTTTTDTLIKSLLKGHLLKLNKEQTLSKYFNLLTTPTSPSFMNEECNNILKIKKLMKEKKGVIILTR